MYSQLLLVISLSGQKIGPGTCLPKKLCPLFIGLSCRFHDKTAENCQNLSFHSLDTKFLPWVINSSLFLDKKSIQIISYTYCGSLHKLWNFQFFSEILWNLNKNIQNHYRISWKVWIHMGKVITSCVSQCIRLRISKGQQKQDWLTWKIIGFVKCTQKHLPVGVNTYK